MALPPPHPPLPSHCPLWQVMLKCGPHTGMLQAGICKRKGRSKSQGEALGMLCPFPQQRGHPKHGTRDSSAPCSPQLPEGDVLIEAQAVVPLLLCHVAPLLPARHEPTWHHQSPPARDILGKSLLPPKNSFDFTPDLRSPPYGKGEEACSSWGCPSQ